MVDKIRFMVDEESPKQLSAFPVPGLDGIGHRVVEVGSDIIKKSVDTTLQGILELLSSVTTETSEHVVSEVSFSLAFDASGEVSVISLAKGTLKGSTGIQFKIVRKQQI